MDHHHTALQSAEKKIIWPCQKRKTKQLSRERSLQVSSCIFPGYTVFQYPQTATCIFLYNSLNVVQFSEYLYMR